MLWRLVIFMRRLLHCPQIWLKESRLRIILSLVQVIIKKVCVLRGYILIVEISIFLFSFKHPLAQMWKDSVVVKKMTYDWSFFMGFQFDSILELIIKILKVSLWCIGSKELRFTSFSHSLLFHLLLSHACRSYSFGSTFASSS